MGAFLEEIQEVAGICRLVSSTLCSIFVDEFRFPKTIMVQKINSWIVHPVSESIHNSFGGVAYIFKNYVALRNVKEENGELKKQISTLELEVKNLQENGLENKRLYALMNLKKENNIAGKVAQIIGEDATIDRFSYLINLGSNDGIEIRSPVLIPDGIVGQVRDVYENTAVVVTLLDPSNIIDGVGTRSRSHALIEGTGKDYLARTKFVDRIEDFKVGDLMLSSGLDGIYPKGYPIGTIIDVQKPGLGVLQSSLLRPAVDYDKLEEVLVLPPLKNHKIVQVSTQESNKGEAR
ncbi:MAG: rod shape-determining protein MreC [Bdellovibrionota bacterium]